MTRAYDETYLDDAMNNLGDMLDYAVFDLGFGLSEFFTFFINSGIAKSFGKGNPRYTAGMSGPELASEVIFKTQRTRPTEPPSENIEKSPEYWTGWILAYYQWHSASRFSDLIKKGLTVERVISLYPKLHEADISKFVEIADKTIEKNSALNVNNLKRIRKASGMTQKKLAEKSGAALRMIQLYEQRKQDINKAQAATLAGIARALGCDIEDLLE
jgi:DNA-binding transcriptional regulator YiaG